MIRRSPCEYYLKYLVSHPDNYSDEQVQAKLQELGLDWLGPTYLQRVRRQTVPPTPFTPYDLGHFASQHFLNKHRIFSLYFKDDATREALRIVETPRLKEFCEAMTLCGSPTGLISMGTKQAFGDSGVSPEGVKRFQHFFWNMDLLDFTEVRALLAKRGSDSDDKDFKKAYYRDSRKIAADLPFNPLSALLSQIRMGITPSGVDFAELMNRIRIVAGIKTYQWILEDHPRSGENARHFMGVVAEATDILERSAKPEEKLRERLHSLTMRHNTLPIPHINQLSEGQHTTDLQATEVRPEVVEVEDEA